MERAPSAFALTSPMLEGRLKGGRGMCTRPHTSKIGVSENPSHKVIFLLEACFDLISGSSLSMKIQIIGGKLLKIWCSNPRSGRSKNFCSFFFSFLNSSHKSGYFFTLTNF
jgi:hypothetical protein